MISHTTPAFRELLAALPKQTQKQARDAFAIFQMDSNHPGLRFKQVDAGPPPIYSVRVGIAYRALGTVTGNTVVWFWIGSHANYNLLLKKL
jgi:hypothetical protein